MIRNAAIVACVLALVSSSAQGATRALLLAANHGLAEDLPLQYAESDAAEMARALVDMGTADRRDVRLVRGATLATAAAELARLGAKSGADDIALVFFSGHGDARGAHLDGQIWPWSQIRAGLQNLPAAVVVGFFDACSSGMLLHAKGGILRGPSLAISAEPVGVRGRFLVTSSGASEVAYESSPLRSSPFALALRTGLRGAADSDHDGRVTVQELYAFVYGRTLASTMAAPAGPQHPSRAVDLVGAGEVVLAAINHAARLTRTSADLGDCYVLDRDSTSVLGELPARATWQLAMTAGAYAVKCVKGETLKVAEVELRPGRTAVETLDFRATARVFAVAKGPGVSFVHRLVAGAASFSVLRGTTNPGLALGYRLEAGDLLVEPRVLLTFPARTRSVLLLLGIGAGLPWWDAWHTRLHVGLDLGLRLAGPGSHDQPPGPVGKAMCFGTFVSLARPLARGLALEARASFLTLYALEGSASLLGGIAATLGLTFQWPQKELP